MCEREREREIERERERETETETETEINNNITDMHDYRHACLLSSQLEHIEANYVPSYCHCHFNFSSSSLRTLRPCEGQTSL